MMKNISTVAGAMHFTVMLAALLLLAGCAESRQPLQPTASERVQMTLQAAGVQVYTCRNGAWEFVAPEADLYNGIGQRVGRHSAGPTWEAMDGSRITGTVSARLPAKSADSIPWLLLAAKVAGPEGAFSKVTNVQRIDTIGGVAPKSGCDAAAAGTQVRVPYAAQYVFFTRS
jgi:hypothetical protein